jgi:chaperonin cofactor prefoldin
MRKELEEALEQLQTALESIENLAPDESDRLRRAVGEISSTLDERDVDSATLAKRLHEQTESFQDSHPILTQTVGRIADMLAQMGI